MKQPLITDIAYKKGEYKDGIHYHNGYELIFVTKGEASVTIDNDTFTARAGTLLFISNLEYHTIRVLETPYERYFMNISPAECEKLIGDVDLIALLRCRPIGFKHTVSFENDIPRISMLWDMMIEESQANDEYGKETCASLLKTLLILAKRRLPDGTLFAQNHMKTLLHELQDHLEKHFSEDISIGDLCQKYYANHFYLTHSFKAYTGYSPKQYLTLLRLNHAISLFTSGNETISAAALASGFSNVNNFIRCFKATFGMTPTEYKKRHIGE